MSKFIATTALLLTMSGIAAANPFPSDHHFRDVPSFGPRFAAPEIDPASTICAITLLLGGLAVMRGRVSPK